MPDFRTKIQLPKYPFSINHHHQLLSLGSCFAENIGQRLINLKFKSKLNPFGIIYNPISMIDNLTRLLDNKKFTEKELVQHNDLWHSFAHHSIFSKMEKAKTLIAIQSSFEQAQTVLKNTDRLILTFGTAHIYQYLKTGQIVANCHKIPNQEFQKRGLTVSEITENCLPVFKKMKWQNVDLQIIITVSPIRHLRDGLLENQKSKATLLLAAAEICEQLDFVYYFPSYEMMMDDLRDYRFYEADMIHPNQVAIDYIWQQFQSCFFAKDTQFLNQKIEKINTAANHRSFHSTSFGHQQFLENQLVKIANLANDYPFLNFEKEREIFQKQKK